MARRTVLPCAVCDTPIAPTDTLCPTCGAHFDGTPPPPPETYLKTIAIAGYAVEPEAGLAQGILAEAGIESYLTDFPDNAVSFAWRGHRKVLRVREDRAESALALLAGLPSPEPAAVGSAVADSAPAGGAVPPQVKGYSGRVMKVLLLAGFGYLFLALWQYVLVVYALLAAGYLGRRWFGRKNKTHPVPVTGEKVRKKCRGHAKARTQFYNSRRCK